MNGEEVHNLTLLGKVVKANVSATTQEYVVDDGTGAVNVKRWVDAEDESAKGAVAVGQYVRVYGHVRVFQGVRSVIAFNLRPVTDFNEVTHHFLEVNYCNAHNGAAGPSPPPGRGHRVRRYRRARRRRILQRRCVFHLQRAQGQDPNGVNIADVVAALNGRFTDAQVREAVESLVNDGHLYSTIDDAHFRSTLL